VKPGELLINTSRGHIIDLMAEALRGGHLGGAAIDVFNQEPVPANAALQSCPGLVLTPHISGVSTESNTRVSEMIADLVAKALQA
jgi:(S)-sulfolactate dehydrogenase